MEFNFHEKYTKRWYYEFDLGGKFFFIYLKVDHDRSADAKVAGPTIEELRNQKVLGFGLASLNHEY